MLVLVVFPLVSETRAPMIPSQVKALDSVKSRCITSSWGGETDSNFFCRLSSEFLSPIPDFCDRP